MRVWTLMMTLFYVFSSFFVSDFTMAKTPIQYILGYVLYALIMMCLTGSYCLGNMTLATIALYLYHVRVSMNFTVPLDLAADNRVLVRGLINLIG